MDIFNGSEQIAGLILLSTFIPFILLIFLIRRGELPSIYGLFRPIEELAGKLPVSRLGLPSQIMEVALILVGFAMISVLLQEAGDTMLALTGFGLLTVAVALIAFEGSFYFSVNPWAAKEASSTGNAPEIFSALHHWMNKSVQMIYVVFAMLAFLVYGWSFLRTGIVPCLGWLDNDNIQYWMVGLHANTPNHPPGCCFRFALDCRRDIHHGKLRKSKDLLSS